jgi:hypothetical protein
VVARDGMICGICGHGGAITVDHIVTVRDWPRDAFGELLPGVDDPENLRAAHGSRRPRAPDNPCPECRVLCNQARGAGSRTPIPETHSRIW